MTDFESKVLQRVIYWIMILRTRQILIENIQNVSGFELRSFQRVDF